jgi:hypothetical protein
MFLPKEYVPFGKGTYSFGKNIVFTWKEHRIVPEKGAKRA